MEKPKITGNFLLKIPRSERGSGEKAGHFRAKIFARQGYLLFERMISP